MVEWKILETREQLNDIVSRSSTVPQLIFKHSTRCSISSMAKGRLERQDPPANVEFNFLDLLRHREISNEVSELFNIVHESPQVILVVDGKPVFDASHNGVSMDSVKAAM